MDFVGKKKGQKKKKQNTAISELFNQKVLHRNLFLRKTEKQKPRLQPVYPLTLSKRQATMVCVNCVIPVFMVRRIQKLKMKFLFQLNPYYNAGLSWWLTMLDFLYLKGMES